MCYTAILLAVVPVADIFRLPPDGLLTSGQEKHNVELEYLSLYPNTEDFTYEDNVFIITKAEELNTMSTGEDESSPGLNGRLRPRKSTITTPSPHKSTRKSYGKFGEHRTKKTITSTKASPINQDDITTKSDISLPSVFLCPYCDRKFTSKQTASKHARRIHLFTSKQDNFIKCLYCNHSEAESNHIIKHMVDNHPNQYFACLDCYTRFSATTELAEHKHNVCEKQKLSYRSKLRQKPSRTRKNTKKSNKSHDKSEFQNENTECSDEHRFNGMVISCELKPSQTHEAADIEDNLTTNLILPPTKALGKSVMEKNAVIVLDDIQWNKRIPPNFSFHNTDADQILSRLGVVHRSPRVGESTKKEWIKIVDESTQKFERCFDTNFYSKVAKNVQENLTKFLDGSFNFNPNKENTIKTRKAKTSVVINTAEGFPILLAYEQYSRNLFDGYMPRALAPKHKWKWDNAETDKNVVVHVVDSKRDSHVNNCIITLVSSLDIWTQLQMRRKFEDIFKVTPTPKKTKKQNIIGSELKEILESRDIPSNSTQVVKYQRSPPAATRGAEPPAHLGLKPTMPPCELKPAVLSGEWVRPRCYVCCACGEQTNDARTLSSHISTQHPNAQVQHYEIVGETLLSADILKHLYVPPSQMSNRTRPPRGFRDCTKCKKSITLEDLHQHMLDCAGDTPAVRRKCRYRPFGVRRRRPRLPDNTIRKKMRKNIRSRHRQKCHLRARPRIRTEVGDAETIRKMIADLPAKRNRIPPRRITAKKAIKLRPPEDIKTAKARSVKNITRLKKTVALKKQAEVDSLNIDEDDQPLKISSRRESIKNTASVSSNSKAEDDDTKNCLDQNLSENLKYSVNTDILMQNEHQKVDVYGAGPSNVRQHSNRSNSNNQDNSDRRPSGEKKNGSEENNITPAPYLPFKQCIGSSTSKAESIERDILPCDSHCVPGQNTSPVPRTIPDDQQTFENESAEDKLDKPPIWKDSQDNSSLSRDKSKLSKNKKGLEHCIAMLRTKKGLPGSNKGNEPLNPAYRNSEASDQASSKTQPENKSETMHREDFLSSAEDDHQRKKIVENLMKIQNESTISDSTSRSESLGRNEPKITDTMASNKPLELTPWVTVPGLNIASDAYSDFNLMRRKSYELPLTTGHSLYQNAINATSAMNAPNIPNDMNNTLPHMSTNADNIAWHHSASYRQEVFNQYIRAGIASDSGLPTQYANFHHGQIDSSIPVTTTPKKRRDSTRKYFQDQQRDRKQKISPPGKLNTISSSYDSGKQIRASPEGLNTHVSNNCYLSPEIPIHMQAPAPYRVRRDSQKRGADSSESEMNFMLSADNRLSGQLLRKSPMSYYPENSTNSRRHSLEFGASTHTNKTSYDANNTLHQQPYMDETLNMSPLSRGRSESRTATPDSHRLFYEHERARELNNKHSKMHSLNMPNLLTMRHDLYEEIDSRYINMINHEKQQQDAMVAHIQNMEYKKNKCQTSAVVTKGKTERENSAKKDADGTQQKTLSIHELQHKQRSRKRSEDQTANVYQPNIPSDKHQNQNIHTRDNQDNLPQNNFMSFGNLPKSLEITAQNPTSGIYMPPDFRTKPVQNYSSESNNKRRYSETHDSTLMISSPHMIHQPDLVYSMISAGVMNPSSRVVSKEAVPEIPLDLSRKDHNVASTKVTTEPSKTFPEIPIIIEKQNKDLAANLEIATVHALNLSSQNLDTKEGILSEHRTTTDGTQSGKVINERTCELPENLRLKKINTAAHDFPAAEELSEPSNLVLVDENRINLSMASPNVNNSVYDSEIELPSNRGIVHDTKNTEFKRHPFYNPMHLHYHDKSNKASEAQPRDIEAISRNQEIRHASSDCRKNDIAKPEMQHCFDKITSDNTPLNLITTDMQHAIIRIESDDEESQHKTAKKLYDDVNITEVSSQAKETAELLETNSQIINASKKILTDQNKGLDPETFANLEELVVNNEARNNRHKSDTPDINSGSLKTIHQYIANVLEQMNEVQIKRMLGISPTLMAKVKAATVNETIPSSLTPETAIKNNDNLSVAVCPSSIIPKKRYSPSQPFVRLSSSELCSVSPELGTSNLPNDLQASKHHSSSSDVNIHNISNYIESSNKQLENVFESKTEKLDKDSDDSEINVVDIIEPESLLINKEVKVSENPFLPTVVSRELSPKPPIKPKNFSEQTASLRAVRIKTPHSRKCGSDDKNILMAPTKSCLLGINADDKITSADESGITSLSLSNQRSVSKYDQPDINTSVQINYSDTLPSHEPLGNDIITEDEPKDVNSLHLSHIKTIQEHDVINSKAAFEKMKPMLPNTDCLNEEITLLKQNKSSTTFEIMHETENSITTQTAIQMSPNKLSKVQLDQNLTTKDINKDVDIFLESMKPTNFYGDNSNHKKLIQVTSSEKNKTVGLFANNDCSIINEVPLLSVTGPYEIIDSDGTLDKKEIEKNYASRPEEDGFEVNKIINSKTIENDLITLANQTSALLVPQSSPTASTSPKSKKSDAEDSEDDVSLAEILKKRNVDKIITNDDGIPQDQEVGDKEQQELGSTQTESFSTDMQNNTNRLINEEKNWDNDLSDGNVLMNDKIKNQIASSKTPKSPCASNVGADIVMKGYDLCKNYDDIHNVENIKLRVSTVPEHDLRNEIKDININEGDCKPKQILSSNLNVGPDKLDHYENEGYNDDIRCSTTNNDEVKEILVKSSQQVNDKNTVVDFDMSTSKYKDDVENYNELSPTRLILEEETLCIGDLKPVHAKPDKITDACSTNNSSRSFVTDMQLTSEISEKSPTPLRRTRHRKSIYIDNVDDYDYDVLIDEIDGSRKAPITMKRLILSRVQKDKCEKTETSIELEKYGKYIDGVDNNELANTDKLEETASKKVKPIKRKQRSHLKRKTKQSKSSQKPHTNESSSNPRDLENDIKLRELSNADNKVESKDEEGDRISHSSQITPDLINDLLQNTDNKNKEDTQILYPEARTSLPGKRKKNKNVISKSKKAKYSKVKTYSDFDSEDEKELTEIKQKQERHTDNKIENQTESLSLQGKNDEACNVESGANYANEIKATVNVNVAGESRTTCYSRPVSNKRPLSSLHTKKESINYDPYDIDFDEMIESTGPVLKRKNKTHMSKTSLGTHGFKSKKVKSEKTLQTKSNEIIPLINHDSDSDSSKSDVPLQKYVDEKEYDQKCKNDNNNKSLNIDLVQTLDESKEDDDTIETSDDKYEDEGANDSNKAGSRLSCKNKKPVPGGHKREEAPAEDAVDLDQNLNMNNNETVTSEPKRNSSKEKKRRRTLAVCNDVDSIINEEREARSDKFMENFGFYSERMPRKSNLLASKKIAETFNATNNESDDSHLGYKETKRTRKSSQGKGEKTEPNMSEDAASGGNNNEQTSSHISDNDNSVSNDEHNQHTSVNEIDNCPSQSFVESEHLQSEIPPSPNDDTNVEKAEEVPLPVTDTEENVQKTIEDKPSAEMEGKIVGTTKKTKGTPSKQSDKEYIIKPKMYPDIDLTEIDLMEDKFDKIKRKRRSQAVAAKQIQTIVEASSSKRKKLPERRKSGKSGKKKCLNSQVPTKGALKGFESIKISIPTQDLNMPSSVSPPRQQKRKRKGSKRRKGVSESGSSCSEYDDKGKMCQDRDVYEFKDSEDTELLELRPSTVMDRFRSIHNTNKIKNKDKGKDKEKLKEKFKKTDTKERHLLKEERARVKAHSSKKDNGKEHTHEDEMTSEGHSSEVEHIRCKDLRPFNKCSGNKNVTSKRSPGVTGDQDVNEESTHDAVHSMQATKCNRDDNHSDDAVPSTSGFVPDRDDESDYESESSIAGGCIVYKSDEFNCLCHSDLDSEDSDAERSCGKSNCIYRHRNADKNAAIGNIFKNNAVRCDKPEIKVVDTPKPDLDQLFDSLLETKSDELSRNENNLTLDTTDLFPVIDKLLEENGSEITITDLKADSDMNKNSYARDTLTLNYQDSPKTDNNVPFMTCEDSYPNQDYLESNVSTKTGVYNMVSTKSTQTGLISKDNETDTTYNKRQSNPDDDDFDINEKESDEWMVFQELICPASKSSQTDLSKLMYHEHVNCDLDCQSELSKYLEEITPSEVSVVVSTRGSQTVILEKQIHDVHAKSQKINTWKLTKKAFGVEITDNSTQTDLPDFRYLDERDDISDDNALSEQDEYATTEETGEGNTNIYTSSKRTNDRAASLPEGATCSSLGAISTAQIRSPSRKSDEGISTSHDCSADVFDQTLDDAGVARQRARRKCTVGKQNVLAEHWSSESEAEATPPRRNSVDSVVATVARKKRGRKKEHGEGSRKGSRHGSKRERKHGRAHSEESEPGARGGRRPPGPKIRAWPRLHHSSDSEDAGPQPQHGWIVGDSHKKLVTMLAHAKGRKRHSDDRRQLDE